MLGPYAQRFGQLPLFLRREGTEVRTTPMSSLLEGAAQMVAECDSQYHARGADLSVMAVLPVDWKELSRSDVWEYRQKGTGSASYLRSHM